MRRIPRQRGSPPTPIPLPLPPHTRPLRQPLAPNVRVPRQRKQRRTERFREILRVLIPNASDFLRGAQALVAALGFTAKR